MIGVAALALLLLDVLDAAMKALPAADIPFRVVVTIKTKLALHRLTEGLVAFLALFFILGMPGDDGARHDQRFERPCLRAAGQDKKPQRNQGYKQACDQSGSPVF